MNIIESFYILFKGDTSDLKKGATEAKKTTDDLDKTIRATTQDTEKSGKAFVQLIRAAAGFIGVGVAAHKVLAGIAGANDYALKLGDASRALGVNAADLDAWGNAVKRNGGTVEGFQQSLRGLAQHFGTSSKVALAALPKLADAFHRLGSFRSLQYGKMLGLDEATILLLQQGRREVEDVVRRQKELGTVTQVNIEDAQKYRQAQVSLDTAFRTLYLTLAHEVIPIFTEGYKKITPLLEYLVKHKDLVIGAFIGIGAAAVVLAAPFVVANAAVITLSAGIVALIGLFALLFEDFKYYNENKPSLIGETIKAGRGATSVLGAKSPFGLFGETEALDKFLQTGKNLMIAAESSPLNSQTSVSSFAQSSFARNTTVNTGPINVHTQATDAVGIIAGIGKGLEIHLDQTANNLSDGMAI